MAKKITLWLILLIGILGFYYLYEKPKQEKKEVSDLLGKGKLASEVTGVSVRIRNDAGVRELRFVKNQDYPENLQRVIKSNIENKSGSKIESIKFLPSGFIQVWGLSDKPGLPLKEPLLAQLISSLLTLKLENRIKPDEQEDASSYGLDDPERIVSVQFLDGSSMEIFISPLDSRFSTYYLRIDGDPNIYLVSELDLEFLTIDPEKVHAEHVFNTLVTNVKSFRITTADNSYLVDNQRLSDPRIVEPFKGRASIKSVQDIFDELKSIVVDDWVSYGDSFSLEAFGLDRPLIKFEIQEKDKDSMVEVRLGYTDQQKPVGFVSNYPKAIFRPSLDPNKRLLNYIASLREKRPFRFSIFDVSRFTVKYNNAERAFIYRDGKWFEGGSERPSELVEKVLTNLKEFEAAQFFTEKTLTQPELALEIYTNSGESFRCNFGLNPEKLRVVECDEYFAISESRYQDFLAALEQVK